MWHSSGKIMGQVKGILNGKAVFGPILWASCYLISVPDTDHIFIPIEYFCVVAQETEPEFSNWLIVAHEMRPSLFQILYVFIKPTIPTVNIQICLFSTETLFIQFLQARQNRWRRVHQIMNTFKIEEIKNKFQKSILKIKFENEL